MSNEIRCRRREQHCEEATLDSKQLGSTALTGGRCGGGGGGGCGDGYCVLLPAGHWGFDRMNTYCARPGSPSAAACAGQNATDCLWCDEVRPPRGGALRNGSVAVAAAAAAAAARACVCPALPVCWATGWPSHCHAVACDTVASGAADTALSGAAAAAAAASATARAALHQVHGEPSLGVRHLVVDGER